MMDALTTFTVTVVIVFVAIAVLKKVFIPKPVELPAKPRTRPTVDELQEFTLSDVAKGDGFDGRPAYLAVDGFVFDMSSHPSGLDFYCAPDAPYRVFIGRDASTALALMSTKPEEFEAREFNSLTAAERQVMNDWKVRFEQKYHIVGSLSEGQSKRPLDEVKAYVAKL